MTHIACVDAYEGAFEPITETGALRPAGLGLPWTELAELLDARVTLLDWSEWYGFEERGDSPASWMRFPATRRVTPGPTPRADAPRSPRIGRRAIVPLDPDSDARLDSRPLGKRAHVLLSEGDPLFFLSVLLHRDLVLLHREEPVDLLVMPMWGGLGYVTQLEMQAAGSPLASVATAVVVTSTSRSRLTANQEGNWTRPAVIRHQREELSLLLADVALALGPDSFRRAQYGRLRTSNPPVLAPRFFDVAPLAAAPAPAGHHGPPMFSHAGPMDGSSGALALLDAARVAPAGSFRVTCGGEDRVFAPMAPRSFRDYWSSRAWARELVNHGTWSWDAAPADQHAAIRLYVGQFEHLTNPLPDLAAGSLVLLGPAAADSLGSTTTLPEPLLVRGEPTPELLAERLTSIAAMPRDELWSLQSPLRSAIIDGSRGPDWEARLQATAAALRLALRSPRSVSLAQALMRQVDPRLAPFHLPEFPAPTPANDPGTLTVVVPCFAVGALVEECVTSAWQSSRVPDEVIVVDDGSTDVPTREALERIARRAADGGLPLRIHRQENRGLAGARNAGLGLATSTFISFLDADDLIDPAFYDVAVALLRREPLLGGVSAWAAYFGDDTGFWNPPQPELPLLLAENQVIVPMVMRTAILNALGGYDERQRYNYEDWELAVRLLARGHPIVSLPRDVLRYRVRQDSLYRTMTPTQHQVMRELLLDRHRATVTSFATELALQLEHRHAERAFARSDRGLLGTLNGIATSTGLRRSARTARNVIARAAAGLRRMARS